MNDGKGKEIEYYKSKLGSTNISFEKYKLSNDYLDSKVKELKYVNSQTDEFKQTKAELIQSVKLVKMIHKVSLAFNDLVDKSLRIKLLEEVVNAKQSFINEQTKLWKKRNKLGGLQASLSYIESFMEFSNITLKYLKNGEQ